MASDKAYDPSLEELVRRLALIGRSGSGKTCIFAALAMAVQAREDGMNATWLMWPPWLKRPSGEWETWPKDSLEYSYSEGADFLEKAVNALANGKLPEGNPPKILRLAFKFTRTKPELRTLFVEFVDYSGEWVDPKTLTVNASTEALKRYLSESDAVLVLAEAPRDGLAPTMTEELLRLKGAFAQMHAETSKHDRENVVGLLINKYDRRISDDAPAEEPTGEDLELFFLSKPQPYHRSLRDSIRGENVIERTFGLSAFGRSVVQEFTTESGETVRSELPASFESMPSFGLESPFFWATDERDKADAKEFVAECERLRVLSVSKADGMSAILGQLRRGRRLARRLRAGSPERRLVTRGIQQGRRILLRRAGALAATVASFVISVDGLVTRTGSHQAFAALENPNASNDQQEAGLAWLDRYAQSPPYEHLLYRPFLSSTEARAYGATWRMRRVEEDWRNVLAADDNVRPALASAHVKKFPASPHLSDAGKIIADHEAQSLENEARAIIDPALAELKAMREPTVEQLRKLEEQLGKVSPRARALPRVQEGLNLATSQVARLRNEGTSRGIKEVRDSLDRELRDRENQVSHSLDPKYLRLGQEALQGLQAKPEATEDQRERARALLRAFDERLSLAELAEEGAMALSVVGNNPIGQVADTIRRYQPAASVRGAFDAWKAEFCREATQKLLRSAEASANKSEWTPAVDTVDYRRGEAAKLFALLSPTDQTVLQNAFDAHWLGRDRALWEDFRHSRSRDRLKKYLATELGGKAPVMRQYAQKWEEHFSKVDGPLDLIVCVDQISMGNGYEGYQSIVWKAGDETLFERNWDKATYMYASNKVYGRDDPEVGIRAPLKGKRQDVNLTFFFRMKREARVSGTGENGSTSFSATPLELDGKEVTLSSDFSPPVKVRFKVVEGLPDESLLELPPWSGRQ